MIKEITITNASNEKIYGLLKQKRQTKILLIICHGFKSSQTHPAISALSDLLYKYGYAVFTFNYAKNAEGLRLDQQVQDIQAILKYFSAYERPILIAGSFGALSASIAAIQLKQIQGLVTLNGFFGSRPTARHVLLPYIIFKTFVLINPLYRKVWKYFTTTFQPSKIRIPVLVIHAKTDEQVPYKQSEDFYGRLHTAKTFVTLQNADHHLTAPSSVKDASVAIDAWIKKTFK